MGCPMGHGYGEHKHWGGGMMQSWHDDDGGRVMAVHMWPMIFFAWMLFMLGVMVGAKKAMMAQRMRMMGMGGMGPMGGMGSMGGMGGMGMKMGGMGMCGPGMMHHHHGGMMHYHGGAMKAHHHHGGDTTPCCEKHGGEMQQGETSEGAGS